MSAEYQPVTDLDASRSKLSTVVLGQVEIPDRVLFEGILDVLASRGTERWRELDELWLNTKPEMGMKVVIGFQDPAGGEYPNRATWIEIDQKDGKTFDYTVDEEGDGDGGHLYTLSRVNSETGDVISPVNNFGELGAARLLHILSEAHNFSPVEVITDEDFDVVTPSTQVSNPA